MKGYTPKAKKRHSKKAQLKRVEAAKMKRMRNQFKERREARARALEAVMKEGKDIEKLKRENEEARRRLNQKLRSKVKTSWRETDGFDQSAGFEDLRRRWLSAVMYISRFREETGQFTNQIRVAEQALREIEAEWKRRTELGDNEPFRWPTTSAGDGIHQLGSSEWQPSGMLAYLGYHVGRHSDLSSNERSELLTRAFLAFLPPLNSASYLDEWGPPDSGTRLKKIAESLAAFTRNARRRKSESWAVAISEWEADLGYLKATFYDSRFDFRWPPSH